MCYDKERIKWKLEHEMKVPNDKTEIITMKLAKHFKLSIYNVYFRKGGGARAYRFGGRIKHWNNTNMLTVIHEVCHFLCWKKFNKKVQHNSKKWLSQMKIIVNYCRRKNYWNDELERRTTPKISKPEPTKKELRLKRVEILENRKESYGRRIRLSQNRIKKLNRQIGGLKRFI